MESYKKKLQCNEKIDEDLASLVAIMRANDKTESAPTSEVCSSTVNRRGVVKPPVAHSSSPSLVDPELSGKLLVLFRMMQTMKAMKSGERIVIVSNFTSTLDLIEQMCRLVVVADVVCDILNT